MFATPFIDETFDIYNCRNYILSIQCALDGFSFSVYDTTVNKFIVFSEYDINTASDFELKNTLEELIKNEAILQQHYKKVKIAYVSNQYTFVPEALYTDKEKKLLLSNSAQLKRTDNVESRNINSDIHILFAIPDIILTLFKAYYPNAAYFHCISPLLMHASRLLSSNNLVQVYLHNHTLFILVVNHEKVVFHNSFYVKNTTDSLYYILNTLKKTEADSSTEVILYGKIKPRSELEAGLKRFIEKVSLAHFSQEYAVSYTLYKEPENYHLTTIELALCE